MRIFLVENHPDTLAYVRRHLSRAGHVVESAQTVMDALKALSASSCDALLTDLGLPDGDGCDLLEKLGASRPPIAILKNWTRRCSAPPLGPHLMSSADPKVADVVERIIAALVEHRRKEERARTLHSASPMRPRASSAVASSFI
ncbi:MAG: response regulator [Chthoniobacteraceae bacterium]